MDSLLDSIRIAMRDGASDDERRRGAVACRTLGDALEGLIAIDIPDAVEPAPTTLGDSHLDQAAQAVPSRAPDVHTTTSPMLPLNPFTGMTADQILDLAIAKLRATVGDAGTAAPPAAGQPFRLTLVPVPRLR